MRAEYEKRIADLQATYPAVVARRLAEGLLHSGNGAQSLSDALKTLAATPGISPLNAATAKAAENVATATLAAAPVAAPATAAAAAAPATTSVAVAAAPAAAPAAAAVAGDDTIEIEAYIESLRCTTCNECTNLNRKMFAYNANKQATVKDPKAGTFQQLVLAAERCPVKIIHPGTPLNPKEKDLEKWVTRAKPFN